MNITNIFKSEKRIIREIHNEFDSAQDRLLTLAKSYLANADTDIGERAKKIGFTSIPAAIKANQLVRSREDAELIEYYKMAYPFLKFLTVSELERICKKYGLVYAESSRYIKDIPEKNIRDIEQSQPLKYKDAPPQNWQFFDSWPSNPFRMEMPLFSLGRDFVSRKDIMPQEPETIESPLSICAPKSHFNLDGTRQKGVGFFEVKDPIVFRYVRGGVQIITKWGLEAEDPELFVDRMN